MRRGTKTTEFWLTVGIQVVGAAMLIYCPEGQKGAEHMAHLCRGLTFLSMALSGIGYTIARGMAKGKKDKT